MPIEMGIWRIDNELTRLDPLQMDKEARLEELLAQDITIANPDWMIIGKQVATEHGGRLIHEWAQIRVFGSRKRSHEKKREACPLWRTSCESVHRPSRCSASLWPRFR